MAPPQVVDTHDGSIELKWAPPEFDGGCPITGYMIEKREVGSPRWSKAVKQPVKGTSHEVPDLMQGASYEFRAIAVNKAGESEPSEPSKAAIAREPIGKNHRHTCWKDHIQMADLRSCHNFISIDCCSNVMHSPDIQRSSRNFG